MEGDIVDKNDAFYEESDEAWNEYFYPGTNVIKNKLGIMDGNELDKVERETVDRKLSELHANPIVGSFDMKHLCDIHKYLFGDIYDWAGEFRTVYMSRDTKHPYFAQAKDIRRYLEDDLGLYFDEEVFDYLKYVYEDEEGFLEIPFTYQFIYLREFAITLNNVFRNDFPEYFLYE